MRLVILLLLSTYSTFAFDPAARSFYQYSDGNYLDLKTSGQSNVIARGSGVELSADNINKFKKIIKSNKQSIQWQLRDLSENKIITQSKNTKKLFYGASITKIFVAGSYLEQDHKISEKRRQDLNDLIVKSSNQAWSNLQVAIGFGDENLGRKQVQSFLNTLSIFKSIGFRGYLGDLHGNELNTEDLGNFIQSSFDQSYKNSTELFKLMFISRTGKMRLKKYFPKNMIIGGKTGTYNGATSVNGVPLRVQVKHHTIVFKSNEHFYSISILSDGHTDDDIASLGRGLFEYYVKAK